MCRQANRNTATHVPPHVTPVHQPTPSRSSTFHPTCCSTIARKATSARVVYQVGLCIPWHEDVELKDDAGWADVFLALLVVLFLQSKAAPPISDQQPAVDKLAAMLCSGLTLLFSTFHRATVGASFGWAFTSPSYHYLLPYMFTRQRGTSSLRTGSCSLDAMV